MQGDYDWAATFIVGACVLDFLSGELIVGSKQTKLHIVHHDYMAACLLFLNLDQIVMHSNVPRLGEIGRIDCYNYCGQHSNALRRYMKEENNSSQTIAFNWSTSYLLRHERTYKADL